jgi:hypothetical protein
MLLVGRQASDLAQEPCVSEIPIANERCWFETPGHVCLYLEKLIRAVGFELPMPSQECPVQRQARRSSGEKDRGKTFGVLLVCVCRESVGCRSFSPPSPPQHLMLPSPDLLREPMSYMHLIG